MRRTPWLFCAAITAALGALLAGSSGVAATTAANGPFTQTSTALLGKDGVTDVYLNTASDGTAAVPSSLKHVQLKSYDTSGTLQYTANVNDVAAPGGVADVKRTDLQRGQPLHVQAQAQTDQSTSTEVMGSDTAVKLRPELSLEHLQSPTKVYINQPFNVNAILHELNGDTGASSTVQILNGPTALDTIQSVQVAAGGTKGLAFSLSFSQVGIYDLTMHVSNVVPGEWDTLHNTVNFTVEVVLPNKPLNYEASYNSFDYTYNCDPCGAYGISHVETERYEQFYVIYSTSDQVSSTGTFRVKQTSESGAVQDVTFTLIYRGGILFGYDYATNSTAFVIPGAAGSFVHFYRTAGNYTYSDNYFGRPSYSSWSWGQFLGAKQSVTVFADIPVTNGTHYGGSFSLGLAPSGYSSDNWYYEWYGTYHIWGASQVYSGWGGGTTVWP